MGTSVGEGLRFAGAPPEGNAVTILVLTLIGALHTSAAQDTFSIRCDLQGIYDEMTATTLGSKTAYDIDLFRDVFYTPTWTFIDVNGQRHDWKEMRERRLGDLQHPALTTMRRSIDKLTVTADGATSLIHFITMKNVLDDQGRYGRPGASHTIAEVTSMRDTWVKSGVTWKLDTRQQLSAPKILIDKLPSEIESPRCP
jgi:hypothetical protein